MIAHYLVDCPVCGGYRVATIKEYDYGVDPETGYHDAGRILKCSACNTEMQDNEIDDALVRWALR